VIGRMQSNSLRQFKITVLTIFLPILGCKPLSQSAKTCEAVSGIDRNEIKPTTAGILEVKYNLDRLKDDYSIDRNFKDILSKASGVISCTALILKHDDGYELWTAKHCLKPQGVSDLALIVNEKEGEKRLPVKSELMEQWKSLYQEKISVHLDRPIQPPSEKHHDPVQLSAFHKAREKKLGKNVVLTSEEEESLKDFYADSSAFGGSLCYGPTFKFQSSSRNRACFLNQDLIRIDLVKSLALDKVFTPANNNSKSSFSEFERSWRESFELREIIAIKYALFNASLAVLDACGKTPKCMKDAAVAEVFKLPSLQMYKNDVLSAVARINVKSADQQGVVAINPYVKEYLQVSRNISRLWSKIRGDVAKGHGLELNGTFDFNGKRTFGRTNLEAIFRKSDFVSVVRGYGVVFSGGGLIFRQGDSGSLLTIQGGLPLAAMSRLNNLDTSGGAATADNLPILPPGVSVIDVANSSAKYTIDLNDASLSEIEGKTYPTNQFENILQDMATSPITDSPDAGIKKAKISVKPAEIDVDAIGNYLKRAAGGC